MDYIENRNKEMFDKGAKKGYICTCCRNEVSLDNSASYRGNNLVCYPCIYRMERVLGLVPSVIIAQLQKVGSENSIR